MSLVTDPTDPRLTRGVDAEPTDQAEAYLVLSPEERARGFVRPLRDAYRHTGEQPRYPLRDLTEEEHARYDKFGYVAFEKYPEDADTCVTGRFWTKEQMGPGCGTVTTMARGLAETYARNPSFYGSTYCCGCRMHLPVKEFKWLDGQTVGS